MTRSAAEECLRVSCATTPSDWTSGASTWTRWVLDSIILSMLLMDACLRMHEKHACVRYDKVIHQIRQLVDKKWTCEGWTRVLS